MFRSFYLAVLIVVFWVGLELIFVFVPNESLLMPVALIVWLFGLSLYWSWLIAGGDGGTP